jgi:hypothetical protein
MRTLENHFVRSFVVLAAISLFGLSPASAVLTDVNNGNFNIPDLFGWTVNPDGKVSDGGGYAFFEEKDFDDRMSSLWQEFTLPVGAQNLSFELTMVSEGGGLPTTDVFTVSLLDYTNNETTVLYSLDNEDAYGENYWEFDTLETLNVSSFANRYVRLKFGLLSDADGWTTTVALDNVIVTIPAPGALILALIGTATVGLIRKLHNTISRT